MKKLERMLLGFALIAAAFLPPNLYLQEESLLSLRYPMNLDLLPVNQLIFLALVLIGLLVIKRVWKLTLPIAGILGGSILLMLSTVNPGYPDLWCRTAAGCNPIPLTVPFLIGGGLIFAWSSFSLFRIRRQSRVQNLNVSSQHQENTQTIP